MAATWPEGVRKRVLRATEWETPVCVIAEETRCGRKKTRPGLTQQPDSFGVEMRFTRTEKVLFKYWYKNTIKNGSVSFMYPNVDEPLLGDTEYRFVPGTTIRWSNPSGTMTTARMEWEEV